MNNEKGDRSMELKLSENIKRMRKERSLTQEALAAALGVTVGAVYKWEAAISSPELGMLVRIAELFDTSVDNLLGYKKADDRKGSIREQIYGYTVSKDRAGLEYAEKALTRYPNDFGMITAAANIYSVFGMEEQDKVLMRRAISLYEKALGTVPYDIDPRYGRLALIGTIAILNFLVDDKEKALEMMKKNNEAGVFNSKIGWLTALKGDSDKECLSKLSSAFWDNTSEILNLSLGLMYYYRNCGDWERVKTVADWCSGYVDSLRKNGDPCFFDKMKTVIYTIKSYAFFKTGDMDRAKELIDKARELARVFDEAPVNHMDIVRLFEFNKDTNSVSILGRTAKEGIEKALEMIGDKKFTAFAK